MIRGRVRDSTGRPVEGARVMVGSSPVPAPDIAAVTDHDGQFRLPVRFPGRYELVVIDDLHGSRSVAVELAADGPFGEPGLHSEMGVFDIVI